MKIDFGIIRGVNTLKWLGVAPLFDNGQSLKIEYYDDEKLHISSEWRLFYEVKTFDEIIKVFSHKFIMRGSICFQNVFIKELK